MNGVKSCPPTHANGIFKWWRAGPAPSLFHLPQEHFDDLMKDTPDEMRPPALVAFMGYEKCPDEFQYVRRSPRTRTQIWTRTQH